jgi:adenylate kinase
MDFSFFRKQNIKFNFFLFLGTPGTGKSTLSQEVAQHTKLNYISITDLAKDNKFYLDYDSELESYELDEDKVIDEIDEIMKQGE